MFQKMPCFTQCETTQKSETMIYNANCHYCQGAGYWEDPIAQQTIICHECRPFTAEHVALAKCNTPAWVAGIPRHIGSCKYQGPMLQQDPWLLVVHCSTSDNANIASYFDHPYDAKLKKDRVVSAHFAYEYSRKLIVQCMPTNRVAWHCGGSVLGEHKKLNFCSIGIEVRGSNTRERTPDEMQYYKVIIGLIKEAIPSLRVAVGHSEIDKNRADPGEYFDWDIVETCGLSHGSQAN